MNKELSYYAHQILLWFYQEFNKFYHYPSFKYLSIKEAVKAHDPEEDVDIYTVTITAVDLPEDDFLAAARFTIEKSYDDEADEMVEEVQILQLYHNFKPETTLEGLLEKADKEELLDVDDLQSEARDYIYNQVKENYQNMSRWHNSLAIFINNCLIHAPEIEVGDNLYELLAHLEFIKHRYEDILSKA
jgi:hypothetical protein